MRFVLFLLLIALIAPVLSHRAVTNPWRDFLYYFHDPHIMTLLSAFGNYFWGYFLAPWVGGNAMIKAKIDYNTNPGLHQFLEISLDDFYVLRMQEEKLKWAKDMGYSEARNSNYTTNPPEEPPK